jgi:hypothetical protein
VVRAIEGRDAGMSVIRQIGERIKQRTRTVGPWYKALGSAKNAAERKEVERAVREWADGDSAAAQAGYRIDVLRTADRGEDSIFSAENRAWLQSQTGSVP